MTFTMRIRDGVVIACHSELGPLPLAMRPMEEAINTVFTFMDGKPFEIRFVNA